VWKNLLKLLHFAGLVGLGGGLVIALVLVDTVDATSPAATAAMHAAIALICAGVIVPSLVVVVLTGMFLVVARPALIGARWVWVKALLGVAVVVAVLGYLQPAMLAAASMATAGALGDSALGPLPAVVAAELGAAWWTRALVVVAGVVAVGRPRLGAGRAATDR
jgi:hypothetical protein